MAGMLIECYLRWTVHIHRMNEERLPRQLIYSQLSQGKGIKTVLVSDSKM